LLIAGAFFVGLFSADAQAQAASASCEQAAGLADVLAFAVGERVAEVLAGTLGMRRGKKKVELRAGDTVEVEPGTPHKFWNASETAARFRCTISPALQFEKLIETMFGLANDGKTNKKGLPNPLRLAVIANHHFDDVRLPFPPAWIQKLGLIAGAPTGRLLGYRPAYVPAETADVSLAI